MTISVTKPSLNPKGMLVPTGALKIDPTHPNSNALNAFVVHGQTQGTIIDLMGNGYSFWTDNSTPNQAGTTFLGPSMRMVQPASSLTGSNTTGHDFVLSRSSSNNGSGDYAIGGQFILNAVPGAGSYLEIFGQSDDAVTNYADVYISSSTNLSGETNSTTVAFALGGSVQLGVPYTCFITRQGSTVSYYINGVLAGSGTETANIIGGSFKARWGSWGSGFASGGLGNLDNLWTGGWNRYLSQEEIIRITADPYGHLISAEGELPALFLPTGSGNTGTLAANETQDVAAITGTVLISGTLSATESPDTLAFTGTVVNVGILAATETQDLPAFTGSITSGVTGTLVVTESQDVAAVTGSLNVLGTLTATEGQDIAALTGTVLISGTLVTTENADVALINGSITSVNSGTLATTEAQDIVVFVSTPAVGGSWRWLGGYNALDKKPEAQTPFRSEDAAIKKAAAVLSSAGGHARAESLTPKQRTIIATKAAQARWR